MKRSSQSKKKLPLALQKLNLERMIRHNTKLHPDEVDIDGLVDSGARMSENIDTVEHQLEHSVNHPSVNLRKQELQKKITDKKVKEDQQLWEKKKEIEREALENRCREHVRSRSLRDRFFDRNPNLKSMRSIIQLEECLGTVIPYFKTEPPRTDISERLEEKLSMLPDLRVNDAVRNLQGDLLIENETGDIERKPDELGDLFHTSSPVKCPDCDKKRQSFRLNSEGDWICDSCFKVRMTVEGIDKRINTSKLQE